MKLDRLCQLRGFNRRRERELAARPNALDRLLALGLGTATRWLDRPAANLRRGRGASSGAGLQALDDQALDRRIQEARQMLRHRGLDARAIDPVVALVAEVAARTLGVRAHPVQRSGARLILQGRFIEMQTGEGKSLTTALAAAVAASAGLPVEVFTVNSYLAGRDAETFAPFFDRLGLSVGLLTAEQPPQERQAAFAKEVLYTVNKDYVFEHLRFRSENAEGVFAQRGLYFAIVDEADSILIDEARTPLIIARESEQLDADMLRAVSAKAATLVAVQDYSVNAAQRRVRLAPATTLEGLRECAPRGAQWPERLLREMVEQALAAREFYRRDRDYIVVDGKVAIVDEYTGRVLADRSWERGLHQLIELSEGLPPSPVRETIARTTFPEFFRRYLVLAGASGTLSETSAELMAVYGMRVQRLPTHLPPQRRVMAPKIFRYAEPRWLAVVDAVKAASARGQAVLVGTRSVAASQHLAERLLAVGIEATVLNARAHAAEAEVIAAAGLPGRVTVATNMAGRGTDIRITEDVRRAGGLCVVLTELHESARIDRQLMGRTARQGDPGQCLIFASLEDELFRNHLPAAVRSLVTAGPDQALPRALGQLLRRWAQGNAEARHRADRARLLDHDEALGRQLGLAGQRR